MIFTKPIYFGLLLLLIPYLWFHLARRGKVRGLQFSSHEDLISPPKTLKSQLLHLPVLLRFLVLILLILAAARPAEVLDKQRKITEGLAMEIILDRSSSMEQAMETEQGVSTRFEAVKSILKSFIFGNGDDLEGRPNDLIGLISFARYADTNYPLSLTHDPLRDFLDSMGTVKIREEDGTSIGDAVALAAARLKTMDSEILNNADYIIQSKIIILLTDGMSNAGSRTPMEAAQLAAEWGIKIYTIGIDVDPRQRSGLAGMLMPDGVDYETMQYLADSTGGEFFLAENERQLVQVYQKIDDLEKSRVESLEYSETKDLYHWFLLAALALLILELLCRLLFIRRFPL